MSQEGNGQKPEKKWYLKKRMFVLYGVLALVLIGSLGGSNDSASGTASNAAPKEEVWTTVTTFNGKGNQDTESFNITGKKVRITATTTGSTVGSYSGVSLEKENGGYTGSGLSISTKGTEPGKGQTTYRSVDSGSYYIQVISGVNWVVTVEQTN